MVDLEKGSKHSFMDYAYSKDVVRDFPHLLSLFDKLIPVLEHYQKYTAAWQVLQATYDAKMLTEMQLEYYKDVYNKKGKINE